MCLLFFDARSQKARLRSPIAPSIVKSRSIPNGQLWLSLTPGGRLEEDRVARHIAPESGHRKETPHRLLL